MFKSCPLKGAGGVGAIKDRVLKLVKLLLPPILSPTQIQRSKKYLYTCSKLSTKIECSTKVGRIIEQAVCPPTVEEVEGKMCSTDWHQCNLHPLLSSTHSCPSLICQMLMMQCNLMLTCLFCSNCGDNRVLWDCSVPAWLYLRPPFLTHPCLQLATQPLEECLPSTTHQTPRTPSPIICMFACVMVLVFWS